MDLSPEDEALRATFDRYQAASAAMHGLERGTTAVRAAHNELRRARLALCQALLMTGWELPDEVRAQVVLDEQRLAQGKTLVVAGA